MLNVLSILLAIFLIPLWALFLLAGADPMVALWYQDRLLCYLLVLQIPVEMLGLTCAVIMKGRWGLIAIFVLSLVANITLLAISELSNSKDDGSPRSIVILPGGISVRNEWPI